MHDYRERMPQEQKFKLRNADRERHVSQRSQISQEEKDAILEADRQSHIRARSQESAQQRRDLLASDAAQQKESYGSLPEETK